MTQVAEHGTIAIPEATATQPATSIPECDIAVADLVENSKSWFDEKPEDMIGLLERLNDAVMAHAQEWVDAACAAKHIPPDQPTAGEEWANLTVTGRYVRLLGAALTDIAAGRKPQFPGKPHPVTRSTRSTRLHSLVSPPRSGCAAASPAHRPWRTRPRRGSAAARPASPSC